MSITDELRKYADKLDAMAAMKSEHGFSPVGMRLEAIADSIDVQHERALTEQRDSLTVGMRPMTDENMAEGGWVRGPLDADGEMWRSGDMSDSRWGVIEGIAYEDGQWLVRGHDISAPWMPADSIRHYHKSTVEDVLREFTDAVLEWAGKSGTVVEAGTWSDVAGQYAAKLRLASDGDEQ